MDFFIYGIIFNCILGISFNFLTTYIFGISIQLGLPPKYFEVPKLISIVLSTMLTSYFTVILFFQNLCIVSSCVLTPAFIPSILIVSIVILLIGMFGFLGMRLGIGKRAETVNTRRYQI